MWSIGSMNPRRIQLSLTFLFAGPGKAGVYFIIVIIIIAAVIVTVFELVRALGTLVPVTGITSTSAVT